MFHTVSRTITKQSFFDKVEASTKAEAIEAVTNMVPSTESLQINYHVFSDSPSGESLPNLV